VTEPTFCAVDQVSVMELPVLPPEVAHSAVESAG
jgi:hypothetical protein